MANVTTSERYWSLTDAAVIIAAGEQVIVRKIVFRPGAIDNEILIQEYGPDGALRTGMTLKANHTDVNLISLDWGPKGRKLNGFKLATISAGTLEVYLGKDV
jgi:hypothetical protein